MLFILEQQHVRMLCGMRGQQENSAQNRLHRSDYITEYSSFEVIRFDASHAAVRLA